MQQVQQADKKKSMSGGYAQGAGSTVRESDRRRKPTIDVTGRVPMTSVTGANFGGKMPPSMKVRYNSSSAKQWLNASVGSFNDIDGTYDLDLRPHAALTNISPDPNVSASQAWPPGSSVSYHSSSAGRWLDAVIVSFIEGAGGTAGTYNLDLRECAEVDRIRPRV